MNFLENNDDTLFYMFWNSDNKSYDDQIVSSQIHEENVPSAKKFHTNEERFNTKTTCTSEKNLIETENLEKGILKKKKYFNIKKYVKYDQIMEDLCSDEEIENDVKKDKNQKRIKIKIHKLQKWKQIK